MKGNILRPDQHKTTAQAHQAFYVDFMPMIQKIQYNVSILNVFDDEKSKKHIINEINTELAKAVSLLKQIKRFSDKVLK